MDNQRQCFTVTEFCETHRISRARFYEMRQEGTGPRVMKVGKRTLVSAEAAEEWRRRMERADTAISGR
jgi:hypothetical protein